MSKIFGYTKKGGKDWFSSDAYSDKEIEAIKDPEGGSEISLPTAIPSPFARIDLVKTAFSNIAKTPNLVAYSKDGNVIASKDDEKLVSDCLDLAEMLFNIDSLKDNLKIIVWDKDAELAKLKGSSDMHRRFAETLELYLDQDKESYNFDLLKRLYLIEYNHKIIGCTSPATIFFATANDLTHAQLNLTKNDVTFDEQYTPLYERDIEFQKYIYLLFKANPILSERMKNLLDYLNKNLKLLDKKNHALYEELNKLDSSNFNSNYSELGTGIMSGDVIEVIGVPLRKRRKEDIVGSIKSSDFIIKSSKYKGELMPLALQNNLSKSFRYANDTWDNTIKVPYSDNETVIQRRWLPGVRIQYPYLTVSDFLEPYLIRLVYPVNKDKFFDGNLIAEVGDDSKGFILPIKKQFFDYFTSDDLISTLPDKPRIEMVQGAAGSVKVTLRIPVAKQDEFISFERIYYQSSENQLSKPDEEKNKGVIVEHQFGIAIFPFIKTKQPDIETFYRIQLIDRDIVGHLKNSDYNLIFYSESELVEAKSKTRSNKMADDSATSKYYILNKEFDLIQLKSAIASGIIIPKWNQFKQGNEKFRFAIDFGTTNTHIEYYDSKNTEIRPFDISKDEEIQLATLFDAYRTSSDFSGSGAFEIRELIEEEFLPLKIGEIGSQFKFPQRTVLAEYHGIDLRQETYTLADFNIPFFFEKQLFRSNNKFKTNLKWAKRDSDNYKRIEAYFEKIIYLIRNKVLLNNGKLAETEIIWFYPTSMKSGRIDDIEKLWNSLIAKYIKPVKTIAGIPESLAPFYYYKYGKKVAGGNSTPAVSIDIGGGTTDVAVYFKNKPLLLSSFKFASNSIFGDGLGMGIQAGTVGNTKKGIASKYVSIFGERLNAGDQYLKNLYRVLENAVIGNSEDLNSFLFSLEQNSKITNKEMFSYNDFLNNDEDLKILFLYAYSAIIFHIADIWRVKLPELDLPNHILFSGNGSKFIRIITSKTSKLHNLTQSIFEGVTSKKLNNNGIEILSDFSNPKETTCKGGLMCDPADLALDIRAIKTILNCNEDEGLNSLMYSEINKKIKDNVISRVKDFNLLFTNILADKNLSEDFKISPASIKLFKSHMNDSIDEHLEDGIMYNEKLDNLTGEDKLEETLFFLPIIGSIYHMSHKLVNDLSNLKE